MLNTTAATLARFCPATSSTGNTPAATNEIIPYKTATNNVETIIAKGISLVGFLDSADKFATTEPPPVANVSNPPACNKPLTPFDNTSPSKYPG